AVVTVLALILGVDREVLQLHFCLRVAQAGLPLDLTGLAVHADEGLDAILANLVDAAVDRLQRAKGAGDRRRRAVGDGESVAHLQQRGVTALGGIVEAEAQAGVLQVARVAQLGG
ncbi:MAG: hypothetical protein ACK56I_35320, partial [bacterium]